jgi:hypothetical protein
MEQQSKHAGQMMHTLNSMITHLLQVHQAHAISQSELRMRHICEFLTEWQKMD